MDTFFGTEWDALTFADVESFLAAAEDEGLTWEAKGTERPHPGSVAKHACGFANAMGGFLLIGVERANRAWSATGVDFGDGVEPRVWLGNVIRNGLRPVPRFDVHSWSIHGLHVAVVRIDSIAEPPCMTSSGEVFERLSGETVPVHDPSVLRRLYERGETRAQACEAEALRLATDYHLRPVTFPDPPYLCLALSVAPTGKVEDVSGKLFTETFDSTLIEAFEALPTEPLFRRVARPRFETSTSRDHRTAIATNDSDPQRWAIRAQWDGSVVVFLDVHPNDADDAHLLADTIFRDVVRPAADASSRLLKGLGGYGRAHVVLNVEAHSFTLTDDRGGSTQIGPVRPPIQAWTDSGGDIGDDLLERMKRELLRACHLPAFEPGT